MFWIIKISKVFKILRKFSEIVNTAFYNLKVYEDFPKNFQKMSEEFPKICVVCFYIIERK